MRSITVWLVLSAALLLLCGCSSMPPVPSSEKLAGGDLTIPHYANPSDPANSFICNEVPGDKPCWCMFCQNETSFLSRIPIIGQWFGPSLKQGSCAFEACNLQIYNDTVTTMEKNGKYSRMLMFSSGPSFSSTALATRYCNYSLQLATKWMIGRDGAPPKLPTSTRAECWLDRDILPLYIYYTEGRRIDPAATRIIADKLDKNADGDYIGPVMVTTELGFDGSDPGAVAAVRGQIDALRTCKKCLVVLAVNAVDSIQRMKAVESILGPPGSPDMAYYGKVDLVGFGFRANDYPDCRVESVVGDSYIFSRDIMRKYSKPTIWLYAGASEGKNAGGTCAWDAAKVSSFYQNLFALQQGLASSGVVGASLYEFLDGTGPLPCSEGEGCGFGLLLQNGSQKHPELNTWSGLCTIFGTGQASRPPLVFSRNTFGYTCDMHKGDQMLEYISSQFNTGQGLETNEVSPVPAVKGLSCGEICPSDYPMPDPSAYDSTGARFTNPANCDKYPLIDVAADDRDVSATFFKSMIEKESGFDPALVSCTDEGNPNCNTHNLSIPKLCNLSGLPDNCAHVLLTYGGGQTCPAGMKPCAYGLAQCIDYPGQFYVQNPNLKDATYDSRQKYVKKCGGDNYNPFDPGNSICCGLNVFQDYVNSAQDFVDSNWHQLSLCDNGLKTADFGWAVYFIAASRYNGMDARSLLSDFTSSRDSGGSCKGEQNFIKYLRGRGFGYAANVTTIFKDAVGKCDSECPA